MLTPEDLNVQFKTILLQLGMPVRPQVSSTWTANYSVKLVPFELLSFWKGHGPRHWAPSIAAAMQEPKDRRDFLGRWGINKAQSNDYVLTSRQIILAIQRKIAEGLCTASFEYDESELLERLGEFAAGKGLDKDDILDTHRVMLRSTQGWALIQSFPALEYDRTEPASAAANLLCSSEENLIQGESEAAQSPFWISVHKKTGFRRLHYRDKCGTPEWRCWETHDLWSFDSNSADAVCKDCARASRSSGEETSSTSGSSSTSEEALIEGNEVVVIT
jgi:hypothetical protein